MHRIDFTFFRSLFWFSHWDIIDMQVYDFVMHDDGHTQISRYKYVYPDLNFKWSLHTWSSMKYVICLASGYLLLCNVLKYSNFCFYLRTSELHSRVCNLMQRLLCVQIDLKHVLRKQGTSCNWKVFVFKLICIYLPSFCKFLNYVNYQKVIM